MNTEPIFSDTGEALAIIPEAPIRFGRPERQGPRENADRAEWAADLEERKARATDQLAKRIEKPELTAEYFKEATANVLTDLETSVNAYQASGGINLPLIQARETVQRLTAELNAAKQVLEREEQKGSLIDRLRQGIQYAEKSLSGLIGSFSALVVDQLILERFGRKVAYGNLGSDTKRELRYHVRVDSLNQYLPHVSAGVRDNDDEEKLFRRANDVANKLDAFKEHVDQEARQGQ
jgi:hypothetical protein